MYTPSRVYAETAACWVEYPGGSKCCFRVLMRAGVLVRVYAGAGVVTRVCACVQPTEFDSASVSEHHRRQ